MALVTLPRRALTALTRALHLDRPVLAPVNKSFRFLERFWPWVLTALCALLYLPWIGAHPFRFEEGRRAAQAIAILSEGNWWQLEIGGQAYSRKPPLLPWLISLIGFLRGGIDEVAVRLPAVFSVLGGSLSAAFVASHLAPAPWQRRAALMAGLAFLCLPFIVMKARIGETDTLATFFCGLTMTLWITARVRGRLTSLSWIAIGAALAGVGLAKGPVPMLFPLIPIAMDSLRSRRSQQIFGLMGAILLAILPLMVWLWLNRERTSVEYLATEMRIPAFDLKLTEISAKMSLYQPLLTIVYLLPWLLPVVAWFGIRPSQSDTRSWAIRALVLYIMPYSLVILLWPEARARYVMPVAWAVAVLAGLAISAFWNRNRLASIVVLSGLGFAVIHQIVIFAAIDGKTDMQVERRALATELQQQTARSTASRILLVTPRVRPEFNILSYSARPLLHVRPEAITRPSDADMLIAEGPDLALVRSSPLWREVSAIGSSGLVIFKRTEIRPLNANRSNINDLKVVPEFLRKPAGR